MLSWIYTNCHLVPMSILRIFKVKHPKGQAPLPLPGQIAVAICKDVWPLLLRPAAFWDTHRSQKTARPFTKHRKTSLPVSLTQDACTQNRLKNRLGCRHRWIPGKVYVLILKVRSCSICSRWLLIFWGGKTGAPLSTTRSKIICLKNLACVGAKWQRKHR